MTENGDKPVNASAKSWKGVDAWEASWGERHSTTKRPSIFIFDLVSGSIQALKNTPNDQSVGQPVWAPDDSGIVFTGWSHVQSNFNNTVLRLGFAHCYNRPCNLYYLPVGTSGTDAPNSVCLTKNLLSAFRPEFSPNGKVLTFLSAEHAAQTGVHDSSKRLCSMDWTKVDPVSQ